MHSVEYYLKELLFDYDCVVVPNFGGFLAHPVAARLVREKRRIYPPGRAVSFNALLVRDDGLLVSAIAREEKVTFRTAALQVEEFTSKAKKALSDGLSVMLEGIGNLTLNREGKMVFQPLPEANLSASSFGLESIFAYPASYEEPVQKRSEKPKDRKPRAVRKKSPASVKWTVALSLPVILFLLYGIIFPYSFQDLYNNYSGIATGIFQEEFPQKPSIKAGPVPVQVQEEPKRPEVFSTIASDAMAAALPADTPVKKETPPAPEKKYYIIGGCFENENNAKKFREDLKKRGYNSEEAGTNNSGHIRISYKSFPVRQDALIYLEEIRNSENPAAWLLKY